MAARISRDAEHFTARGDTMEATWNTTVGFAGLERAATATEHYVVRMHCLAADGAGRRRRTWWVMTVAASSRAN